MFFWSSLAFSMIQQMLAIWYLVPLPFLNPAWTSGSSWFIYYWSLAWRILSITLLSYEMSAIEVHKFPSQFSSLCWEKGAGIIRHPTGTPSVRRENPTWIRNREMQDVLRPHILQPNGVSYALFLNIDKKKSLHHTKSVLPWYQNGSGQR